MATRRASGSTRSAGTRWPPDPRRRPSSSTSSASRSRRLGLKFRDVDRYATELHNPELTEPSGSGNVPLLNYRLIGGLAALAGEIAPAEVDAFVTTHGLPGFAPTQGHIASAIPYLAHALDGLRRGAHPARDVPGQGEPLPRPDDADGRRHVIPPGGQPMNLKGKKVIALGERDGIQGAAIAACAQGAGADVVLEKTHCFV